MHPANAAFWKHVAAKYAAYFERARLRILEVGSYNVNGSVRDYWDLPDGTEYIGVDWRAGPGIDVVSLAHEMPDLGEFDIVVSSSMLEHDPHWSKSIDAMVDALSPEGMLLLSWGAARNKEHNLDTAPDGKFHRLPAGKVLYALRMNAMHLHEFIYEGNHYRDLVDADKDGTGEVCLVAFGKPRCAIGSPRIDELLPEDVWR